MISSDDVDKTYEKLKKEAESAGYRLTPDATFARELIHGLLTNEERYGYQACPCRLASGIKQDDLDIICPCDYRDDDLGTYGSCYCALYVSDAVYRGQRDVHTIPERRMSPDQRSRSAERKITASINQVLPYPVWRCRVCGYLCAREEPPGVCPICKARKDRFERFL